MSRKLSWSDGGIEDEDEECEDYVELEDLVQDIQTDVQSLVQSYEEQAIKFAELTASVHTVLHSLSEIREGLASAGVLQHTTNLSTTGCAMPSVDEYSLAE